MDVFRLMTDEEAKAWEHAQSNLPRQRAPQVQCSCGRFAKFLRVRHHYNGTWDLRTLHVLCAKHGEQEIELV